MKPFYAIDLTTDPDNETAHAEEFLVAQPSAGMLNALKEAAEKTDDTVTKAVKPPFLLRMAQWITGAIALFALLVLIKLLGEGKELLYQAFRAKPLLFVGGGLCLGLWAALKVLCIRREKALLSSEEGTQTISNLEIACNNIYRALSVPADAKDVEILSFFYKVKKGKMKVCEKPLQLYSHRCYTFKMYVQDEMLCLTCLQGKYAFPLSSLQGIRRVDEKIRIESWSKGESIHSDTYQQYRMTTDRYGCVHSKPHYILELTRGDESWGIYFPCYELPAFEELTGKEAPKPKK